MAGDTTFTFLDATSTVKTARAGSDGGGNLAPSAVLYDVNGAVLIGQKTRAASVPIALSSEDVTLIGTLATQATLAAVLVKLSSDPATQTTLAAILAQLVAGVPVSGTITANLGTIDGAATEATLATLLTLAGFQARVPTNGQKTMAGSVPTVIASDQSALPVSVASLPLPSGAATEATLATLNGKIPASPATDRTTAAAPFSTRLSDGAAFYKATTPSDTQPVSAVSLPLPSGAATEVTLATLLTTTAFQARINTLGQKTMANSTPVAIASDQSALPVSAASLPLPSGAATEATLVTRLSESDFDTKIGSLTETAPATDTASSGLNGRLQRIAQRITSLIALIPAALTGSGNFKVAISESTATVATNSTLQTADNTVGRVKLTDGTTVATVRELGVNDALNVAINDGSGNQITTFGGGTQYAEGDTAATATGTAAMWKDAGNIIRAVTAAKPLPVKDNGGLPAALGQTTKVNSLAIVPPSDYQSPVLPTNTAPVVASVTSNNADMVAAMDVSNYKAGTFQVTSVGGGATIQIQFSLDATTWTAIQPYNTTSSSLTAVGLYKFDIPVGCQMRIRTTAYTSGTISGALALSSLPPSWVPRLDTQGIIDVAIFSANQGNPIGNDSGGSDGLVTNNLLRVSPYTNIFNGSTWDRSRGTNALTLLASAARTVTTNSADQVNYNWRGAHVTVDVSSAGTGSITPSLQVKDSISGNYKTIWTAAAALTGNGTYVYEVYPASLGSASFTEVVQAIIGGRTWRLAMVANNANSVTYSASADMIL